MLEEKKKSVKSLRTSTVLAYLNVSEDAKRTVLSIGEAAIGGDWELIDTNGKLVTNKDLLGKWFILYFGFTHCPDVCPDELDKVVAAVNLIGKGKLVDTHVKINKNFQRKIVNIF